MLPIRSSSSSQYLVPSPVAPRTAAAPVAIVTSAPGSGSRPAVSVSVSLAAPPRPEEAAAMSSEREERSTQAAHSASCWSPPPPPAACSGFALLRALAISIVAC
jgi:hypothetical protein